MLTYLSGVGATRPAAKQAKKQVKKTQKAASAQAKQAQKTAVVKAKIERKAIKQTARQQRLTSAGTFVAPIVKKAVKATPPALVVSRIKKARVEGQKRAAFKKAGEPMAVSPSEIFAEPEQIQNADVEFYEGEQEIDEPEFTENEYENNEMQEELGIIYPGYGAVKKAPKKQVAGKTAKKPAPTKKPADPAKKAARQEAVKKVSAQVLNVAKATLEAKGIKFPSKEQVQTQAEEIQAAQPAKKDNKMIYIIGGSAIALYLILKKK